MGGEMTPLPPACVAALRDYSPREAGCPHWLALKPWQRDEGAHDDATMCDWCAPAIVRAVLDAFVAGETEGPWVVILGTKAPRGECWRVFHLSQTHTFDLGSIVSPKLRERPRGGTYDTKREADAVASVLNYLEAKGE